MTSSHFTVATSGIITFLTVSLVAAQSKNSCPDIQRANATGTYRFPGLTESENGDGLVLSSNSSHEWELTQAVFRDPDDLVTEGGSYLAIPRDRSLPDNGAESAAEGGGMQYTTCAQVVKVESIARNETGDCSALLGTECARDLKKHYLSKAKEWAEGDHSDATDYCAAYLSKAWEESEYPGSCKDSDGLESGSQGSMCECLSCVPFPLLQSCASIRFGPETELTGRCLFSCRTTIRRRRRRLSDISLGVLL